MAGYIGSKSSVTQVDGYTEAEADAEFVTKTGDTMTGALEIQGGHGDILKVKSSGSGGSEFALRVDGNEISFKADADNDENDTVMTFDTDGTERMRIGSSSGNVGIGNTVASSMVGTASMTIGTGVSGEAAVHTVYSNPNTYGALYFADSTSGSARYQGGIEYQHSQDSLKFITSTAEAMRIDSSGNLLVNTTSTSVVENGGFAVKPDVGNGTRIDISNAGEAMIVGRTGSDGQSILFYRGGTGVGNISVTGSSTSYNTSSDYRLKENVVDLTGASARVNLLNPSRFNFISDDTNTLVDGFLAHEVASVVPEAITGTKDAMRDEEYEVTPAVEATYDEDGNELTAAVEAVMGTRSVPDYQGIDQSKLVPLLTAALQEALAEITSLKTRVQALEDV